ncbi:aspartate carbamoyltransferase regulatory chain [Bifidobacterium actinocoloniiforme DSM 22766]|uniref:Aspartate carbamoyltransferase regulatory chain n=1 Tax=Bifidobacterium actinocoloniiforme DSM 22766 TaxID=1437605 RepID=A0A086Z0K6_9BIFI|nr:aspartate carbamoyltransferase regulatory subunit [Bifidobacterium actinocoloniiforme]AKV55277.1 aspartate carbamoyltransferase [Bifidobacterium actinocoloniiforme DSM 22766]KFI40056.1 aspartate carbamoyltransferase regulatory chain [Bifidobacterium actinocoloniiforme DSM 22766]
MEVTSINRGVIIDHVPAGRALKVLHYLGLDPTRTRLALIMNAPSERFGSKDIIKIEGGSELNLTVLGFVAPQATVNRVEDGRIVDKCSPERPEHLTGVIRCINPRCVTTVETGLIQSFHLDSVGGGVYRCDYCDEKAEL